MWRYLHAFKLTSSFQRELNYHLYHIHILYDFSFKLYLGIRSYGAVVPDIPYKVRCTATHESHIMSYTTPAHMWPLKKTVPHLFWVKFTLILFRQR